MMSLERSHFVSSAIGDAEIVIGVVAPVGTRVEALEDMIRDRLRHFAYHLEQIRFSELIESFEGLVTKLEKSPEAQRYTTYMDAGNELRRSRADILALAAVRAVRDRRLKRGGHTRMPCKRVAYFLRTLKHPEEVKTLREVYGNGFFLLGVSSSRSARLDCLHEDKQIPRQKAEELLTRDESDAEGHGQQTRDAFQLADAFLALGEDSNLNKHHLWRILDLLFGQTFFTPTREEHAMYLAYATSLRSADLSRQVGAVVLSAEGEVIATGANDVPRAGGGQYWTDGYVDWPEKRPPHDKRDWTKGEDSNKRRRDEIIEDFAERVASLARENVAATIADSLPKDEQCARVLEKIQQWTPNREQLIARLQGSLVMDLTEFGRAVHAEMEALLCCARVGVSPRQGRLFTTTFPCHNCTKHIVAAGIAEVFFIEPYPKSLAETLHGDEVTVAPVEGTPTTSAEANRVIFRAFSGVGPRRFLDLFSLQLGAGRAVSRKLDVKPGGWGRSRETQLRVSLVPTSYLDREDGVVATLDQMLRAERQDRAGQRARKGRRKTR